METYFSNDGNGMKYSMLIRLHTIYFLTFASKYLQVPKYNSLKWYKSFMKIITDVYTVFNSFFIIKYHAQGQYVT